MANNKINESARLDSINGSIESLKQQIKKYEILHNKRLRQYAGSPDKIEWENKNYNGIISNLKSDIEHYEKLKSELHESQNDKSEMYRYMANIDGHDVKGTIEATSVKDARNKLLAKRNNNIEIHDIRIASPVKGENIHESQLNELSPQLLSRYVDKAKPQALGYGYKPTNEKEYNKADKRFKGIYKAQNKIHDNTPVENPKIHDLSHMSHDEVYNHSQTSDDIHDGDVFKVKGGHALMYKAWPTMINGKSDTLHSLKAGASFPPRYKKSLDLIKRLNESQNGKDGYIDDLGDTPGQQEWINDFTNKAQMNDPEGLKKDFSGPSESDEEEYINPNMKERLKNANLSEARSKFKNKAYYFNKKIKKKYFKESADDIQTISVGNKVKLHNKKGDIYSGKIGKVIEINKDKGYVVIKFDDGKTTPQPINVGYDIVNENINHLSQDELRSKAKWHEKRFGGKVKNASLAKAGLYHFKANLQDKPKSINEAPNVSNWSVGKNWEPEKHFAFNDDGYNDAYRFAKRNNLEIYHSFDGEPRYLMWKPRVSVNEDMYPGSQDTLMKYLRLKGVSYGKYKNASEPEKRGYHAEINYLVNKGLLDESILNELSPQLLNRYIKKASVKSVDDAFAAGEYNQLDKYKIRDKKFKRSIKRINGIQKAVDKLTKKSTNESYKSKISSILNESKEEKIASIKDRMVRNKKVYDDAMRRAETYNDRVEAREDYEYMRQSLEKELRDAENLSESQLNELYPKRSVEYDYSGGGPIVNYHEKMYNSHDDAKSQSIDKNKRKAHELASNYHFSKQDQAGHLEATGKKNDVYSDYRAEDDPYGRKSKIDANKNLSKFKQYVDKHPNLKSDELISKTLNHKPGLVGKKKLKYNESQLNELSLDKLKQYSAKAKASGTAFGYGYKPSSDNRKNDKAFKRTQGIYKADNKIKDNTPVDNPQIHDLTHMSHGQVYDHSQTSDEIKDGDILKVKGGHALMYQAWPTMIHGDTDVLHSLKPGASFPPRYNKSLALVKKPTNESQLNELSPKTLGNYIKKSKKDLDHRSFYHGIEMQRGHLGNPQVDDYISKLKNKIKNRSKGIDKAVDKLTNRK